MTALGWVLSALIVLGAVMIALFLIIMLLVMADAWSR